MDKTDYIEQLLPEGGVICRAHEYQCIQDALLKGVGCSPIDLGGRGTLQQFMLSEGQGIIRVYHRGGIARHLLRNAYYDNRPLREWQVLTSLYAKGFPVPEPLGVCWWRNGVLYGGTIATTQVQATDLATYCVQNPGDDALLHAVGSQIRRMHDLGIWHADLQVRNILVTPEKAVYIIDFDNARTMEPVPELQRARNLLRLRRSLKSTGSPHRLLPRCQQDTVLLPFPGGLTCFTKSGVLCAESPGAMARTADGRGRFPLSLWKWYDHS